MTAPAADARLHGLPPVIDSGTRLVVLGSFPGAASLRAQQYYGHPRNDFWPLLGAIWGLDFGPLPYVERLAELRSRGLGLWDVYASCERQGSLDAAIVAPTYNDFADLRCLAPGLRRLAHNGGVSARAMKPLQALGYEVARLPSSSPANAGWSFARKLQAWRAVFCDAGLCVEEGRA